MFVSYPVNPLLVRRCPVMSVLFGFKFWACSKLSTGQRRPFDVRSLCGLYAHKSIARISSVRGDGFCHRITKFCMFCPFSLRNKSVCRSDQALRGSMLLEITAPRAHSFFLNNIDTQQWHEGEFSKTQELWCCWSFNPFHNKPWFFTSLQCMAFENTAGKGEIARYEQFLLFPQCFLPLWRTFCHFHPFWNFCLQTLSVWKSLKFVVWERVKPW